MDTKYGQVAHDLREEILRGDISPGDNLPPITTLMARFECARDTVRSALQVLSREGLVTPLRGVGTVVRDTSTIALACTPTSPARPWADQVGGQDKVVQSGWEAADAEIAERLSVDTGAEVVHRVRHQYRGATVAQVHEQWVSGPVARAIMDATGADLADLNAELPADLFRLMTTAGHAPVHTTETISARMPDEGERDVMQIPTDVPVLVTNRVTVEAGGPVETSTMVGAADRLTTSFTVPLGDR